MLASYSLAQQTSATFRGAPGNYNFTVLDAAIVFRNSDIVSQVNFTGSNFNEFCKNISIYSQNQIVATGNFNLVDDKPTKIYLNPGNFDIKVSPYITALAPSNPTPTPNITALTLTAGGPFGRICINGTPTLPTSYINNLGSWILAPGTYEVSDSTFNPNVQDEAFCTGQYHDNPKVTINLGQNKTISLGDNSNEDQIF
jgi:hypothetical protein